jgi:hypothetical protein
MRVVLVGPPVHELSLADRYLGRTSRNLAGLEGGSLHLVR